MFTSSERKFISYRRVSTAGQEESGLGLEAQTAAVKRHVDHVGGKLIADYVEAESGKNCERVELAKAMAHARRSKATLIIGKIDRLSRNAAFLMQLLDSGVEIIAADNPTVNRLTLQLLAVIAENEARMISTRVKEALSALKERGVLLGSARPGHWEGREHLRQAGLVRARTAAVKVRRQQMNAAYADLVSPVAEWREQGYTLRQIADKLDEAGHSTRRGKQWGPMQVRRILALAKVAV